MIKIIQNEIDSTREFPTLKADFIDFIGYRYNKTGIISLMFQLVSGFKIYGFNVLCSFEDDDMRFIDNNNSGWNKIIFNTIEDSDSIIKFLSSNMPIMKSIDNYEYISILANSSNNNGNRNIILNYGHFILYNYIYTCLKMHRNFNKQTMNRIQSLDEIINIDSDFNIERIFIPDVISFESLTTICLLVSIGDIKIIFTCSVQSLALKKKVLKQNIICRDFNLLDEIYKESCNEDNSTNKCFIVNSFDSIAMKYYTMDNNEKILDGNVVLITEYDDYHQPTAIVLYDNFLKHLEISLNEYIKSPIY